ncbi:hypothetical protein K431DRAFT_286894 [Polychaeton citri CBS 116435]|uniref:Thioredoxin domain-containing protein n=1 Tax=Polychaeton citri CBS 116435 TaxID=1314669 RepID=A0A9P4UN03_9PEZI|nr:hypothetical protein K431DRAFT_286894 [Polychaeton citri CBS 116435]
MTFQQEFASWWAPKNETSAEAPRIGSKAPESPSNKISYRDNKPKLLTFLRHCGCPFAEKTYLNFREAAKNHKDIDFIAVSHSDENSTNGWLKSLPQAGSEPENLRMIVDADRTLYGAWGLGASGWAHVLNPTSLYSVWRLGKEENIWNRPTESGSRWQTSGNFAVDGEGVVKWGGPAASADDIPDFENAVAILAGERADGGER